MLRFLKVVLVTTFAVLFFSILLLQAVDAPERLESKVIPNERLPR